MSSSRTGSPTRVSLDKFGVYRQDSAGSDSVVKAKDSSRSDSSHWFQRSRSSSEGDSKASTPTVNLYTHCGRHTNQYLFGGHSISESIKDILKKKH
ncbi:hypothetical protein F4824DRAFT_494346 [Ustulina deusta]|nr:hypothetical protein F4823DRAFT_564277 [Ustulina deusta]KAI3344089.1 hypothetical protein F4824DRAFT_494346 [Ustulina deusta]